MKIELQRVAPAEIEARSMEIIRSELKQPLPPEQLMEPVQRQSLAALCGT